MAEKIYDKSKVMALLDTLNVAFHLGLITLDEKKGLLSAIRTGSLSKNQESMLSDKCRLYSQNELIREIMRFFDERRSK